MRPWTLAVAFLLVSSAGCFGDRSDDGADASEGDGQAVPALNATFFVQDVGANGAEPSIGVDSSGAIYFQASATTLKSADGGRTWTNVNAAYAAPTTLDPYLWLDPVTDRVFANQLYVACSYLSFSDDGGETWLVNPAACGTPVNDHQKMATGPYVPGSPLDVAASGHQSVYPNVVYYGVNGLADSRVAMSIDGGVTFPFVAESFPAANAPGNDQTSCGGGLHGNIVWDPLESTCRHASLSIL